MEMTKIRVRTWPKNSFSHQWTIYVHITFQWHLQGVHSFLFIQKFSPYKRPKRDSIHRSRASTVFEHCQVLYLQATTALSASIWSNSIVKVCRCHGSVKFIRSSWFGQVNNPQFIVSYFINNYYFNRNLINFLFVSDTQWGMWPNNGTKWLTHREECLACVTFW